MKELLAVSVLSQCGAQFSHEFPADTELSSVAERAQAALAGHRGFPPGQPTQLLHVRTGRRLSPGLSLLAAGLRAGDELLLLPLPPPPPPSPPRSPSPEMSLDSLLLAEGFVGAAAAAASACESTRDASTSTAEASFEPSSSSAADRRGGGSHVNLEDIEAATRHLEPRPPPPQSASSQEPSFGSGAGGPQRITGQAFSRALTPTLVTLIDTCQRLLCTHPDAEKLMQLVRSGSSAPAAPRPAPDASLVRQLAEMGFPEEQARRALALAHNSLADATDCLLAGEAALAAAEAPQPAAQPAQSTSHLAADGGQGFVEPLSVTGMLELFRQYSRAQFRPSQALRLRLLDMGFDEPGVTDALRLHNNDEAQALETLLGGQARQQQEESQEPPAGDSLTGLDPESPLCKALMANPSVQLAMCQPVTLLAFLSILDNPLTLNSWQNQLPGFHSLIRTIASLYFEHSAGGEGPNVLIS